MTRTDTGTLARNENATDGRMPLDWHGPAWDGDTYNPNASPVRLSDVLEHLDGEA